MTGAMTGADTSLLNRRPNLNSNSPPAPSNESDLKPSLRRLDSPSTGPIKRERSLSVEIIENPPKKSTSSRKSRRRER